MPSLKKILIVGATVQSFKDQNQGVDVTFSDNSKDCYDLLVGADGIHSEIRRMVFGPAGDPQFLKLICWRFVTQCPPGLEEPHFMVGHRKFFLLMPIDGGRVYGCPIFPLETWDGDPPEKRIERLRFLSEARIRWVQKISLRRINLLKSRSHIQSMAAIFFFRLFGEKMLAGGWKPLIEQDY